jgi:hypothetical protein
MWIIDNQLARRNINGMTRKNLLGRRYSEEKKALGENQYTLNSLNRVEGNLPLKSTAEKIGKQVGVSHWTVKDAEKLHCYLGLILAVICDRV